MTEVLAVIAALIGLVGGFIERHYEKEKIKQREKDDIDNAIQGDSIELSVVLGNLHDRVLEKNRFGSR